MKPNGFGLIGCGIFGTVHARTYAASPHARLVAVCDQDIERARQAAGKYHAGSFTDNWRDLLKNPEIEAVSVATPDFAHTEIVLAALKAGKHVLVEKPLALTVAECEEIIAARKASGVKLMVDFHNRWSIPFNHVKEMTHSGELGDLLMINIRLNDTIYVPTKMLSWAAKSSPAGFLGSHVVDLIRWLTGAEVRKVYSVSRSTVLKNKGIDTPDFYQTILELSGGCTAFIENCWIVAENAPNVFEFSAEFVGSKGSTFVNASHHRMIEKYTQQGPGFPDVTGVVEFNGRLSGFCVAAIEHFIDCIVNDKDPSVTAEDGLAATKVIAAMEESARSGMPVQL
ncbi:MAG TPA: Gfo/Idh/MocA family oxidoreductase [Cyclobacteriaceae bacterium]|nr:Gfo/Idh/MocA family oxidoreductase [Cyclobacteriaceae bacterium]